MKINWKRVLLSGIVAGIVMLVLTFIEGMLMSGTYAQTPQLWKVMDATWMYMSVITSIIVGIILAFVYGLVKDGIPREGLKKGAIFGIIIWLVGTIPGMLMTFGMMTVPDMLVLLWLIDGLINYIIIGLIISKLYK